jgi:two-component system, cell cycle response regulator
VKALGQIILIEPSEDGRERLAERLRMQGYNVIVAPGPAEGAHLALSAPPAAVIADLWMPSISGVQLCRLLRSEAATENVPVVLRGPDGQRNRFWAERAGAAAYVVKGHMGDLVRALSRAVSMAPDHDGFFTELGHGTLDIRDRIASYLDKALFESVIAAEVRNLSLCGAFDRLFDLFSQFLSQVTSYRWLAVTTDTPRRLALHAHPALAQQAEAEARLALGVGDDVAVILVEDEDSYDDPTGPPPLILPVTFAQTNLGRLAFAGRQRSDDQDSAIIEIIARELGGPLRMASLVEEAQRLATVDPLTGLMNRRALMRSLDIEIERARRLKTPLSIVLFDIDQFKSINDHRGHASGDTVLAAIGRLISKQARKVDLTARWGGEEFVVALVGTRGDAAVSTADRFRRAVEQMKACDGNGHVIPVTASFGVADFEPGDGADSVIDRADRNMYAAKTAGRNCVRPIPLGPEQTSKSRNQYSDDESEDAVDTRLPAIPLASDEYADEAMSAPIGLVSHEPA